MFDEHCSTRLVDGLPVLPSWSRPKEGDAEAGRNQSLTMRVRVRSDQGPLAGRMATDGLVEALYQRLDTVAERVGEDELEVNLLGSYSAGAMQMELELRLRAWEAAQRASGVHVELCL